jgi:hypothetical protein
MVNDGTLNSEQGTLNLEWARPVPEIANSKSPIAENSMVNDGKLNIEH